MNNLNKERDLIRDDKYFERAPKYIDPDISDIKSIGSYTKKTFSVSKLCQFVEDQRLELHPEWQRGQVWDKSRQTLFIESLLLGFPIQPIYLHTADDGTLTAVDGKQRLTTLYALFKQELKTGAFEFLDEFSNLEPLEIPSSLIRKVMDFELDCIVFNKKTSSGAVYKFFERINTKGVNLSTMEIRNCIYNGPGLRFIREISNDKKFQVYTCEGFKNTRLRDMEAILRFFSICYYSDMIKKAKDMSTLLDITCACLDIETRSQLTNMEKDFWESLRVSYEVFGSFSFRKKLKDDRRSRANMAIFEAVLFFIHNNKKDKILKNKEKILDKYFEVIQDEHFEESIGRRSYEFEMLDFRLDYISTKLQGCLK